jgi:hypothetical protein
MFWDSYSRCDPSMANAAQAETPTLPSAPPHQQCRSPRILAEKQDFQLL